jgi:hypothetical protein
VANGGVGGFVKSTTKIPIQHTKKAAQTFTYIFLEVSQVQFWALGLLGKQVGHKN